MFIDLIVCPQFTLCLPQFVGGSLGCSRLRSLLVIPALGT